MSSTKFRNEKRADYRPGTLGYYLSEAGWSPVPQGKGDPLWRRDGQEMKAYDAWIIELRRIYRETRKR